MPCLIKHLTPTVCKRSNITPNSLADAARYEPHNGVYTITNTYHTFQVLKLNAHLDRLGDSARLAGIPLALHRSALRAALRQMIAEGYGKLWDTAVRFRITVPRKQPDCLILSVEPSRRPRRRSTRRACAASPSRRRTAATRRRKPPTGCRIGRR